MSDDTHSDAGQPTYTVAPFDAREYTTYVKKAVHAHVLASESPSTVFDNFMALHGLLTKTQREADIMRGQCQAFRMCINALAAGGNR